MARSLRLQGERHAEDALFRPLGCLVGAILLWILYTAQPRSPDGDPSLIILASAITTVAVGVIALAPWHRMPRASRTAPLVGLVAVTLMIELATGGPAGAYAQAVLLPVLWVALYGSQGEVALGMGLAAAVLLIPALEMPRFYEASGRAASLTALATVTGLVVYELRRQITAQGRRLDLLARTDPLTGVGNRRAWDEALLLEVAGPSRPGRPLVVGVIDVDHFKQYNDSEGHQAGDRYLKEATARWVALLRGSDILARLGGDEFGLMLRGCGLGDATEIVERLCAACPTERTCSAGLAAWNGVETPQSLMSRADAALYAAKEAGRDRVLPAP